MFYILIFIIYIFIINISNIMKSDGKDDSKKANDGERFFRIDKDDDE